MLFLHVKQIDVSKVGKVLIDTFDLVFKPTNLERFVLNFLEKLCCGKNCFNFRFGRPSSG